MGKEPKPGHDRRPQDDHDEPLVVDFHPAEVEAARKEGRQGVGHALESSPAQALQNGQADGIGGDDFRGSHASDADENKIVNERPDQPGDPQGEDDGQEVRQLQGVQQAPDDKPGDHVEGAVGEIGKPADAVDQGEAQGH